MAEQKIKINKRYNDHKLIRKFFPIRYLTLSANEYGELSASSNTGRIGMTSLLIPIPSYDCSFDNYEVTGGSLNGDVYTFGDMDGTAKANFNRNIHHVILETAFGGTISADKTSGYYNDIVTLSTEQTGDIPFQFFSANGAEVTGDQFAFQITDVTAKAIYSFPITYLSDDHVHLTGDDMYIPGSEGIPLQSSYDNYYRISGYDITGGSIVDGKLVATGPCTIKAVQKVNAFTATGNYEAGSDVSISTISNGTPYPSANISTKYAIHKAHTGDIPSAWYNSSNRWKVNSTVSGYRFEFIPNMKFTHVCQKTDYVFSNVTAMSLAGSTVINSGTITHKGNEEAVASYTSYYTNNSTTTTTGVNYGLSAYIRCRSNNLGTTNCVYVATNNGTWSATGYAP